MAPLGTAAKAPSSAVCPGTYTKLPAVGDILTLGDEIYEVDGARSSHLLYGDRPVWRTLTATAPTAPTSASSRTSLQALGVLDEDVEADRHFGANTAVAVERWERRTDQPSRRRDRSPAR